MFRERCGVPASHLLVSASRTHTAPPAAHLFQSEPDPKYTDWLTVRIADCLQQAFERLQPARIGWAVGSEPRLVFNRRYYMKPGTMPTDPFGRNTDQVKMNPPVGSPDIIKAAGPVDPGVSVVAVGSAAVRRPWSADVDAARRLLASGGASPRNGYKEQPLIYARETVILSETFPNRVKTFVQALRIGDLGIATYPGEAFVEMGLELKSKSPFKPTMLIELANDYRGYIPTVEGHELGGYETRRAKTSSLEINAGPKFVASVLAQ